METITQIVTQGIRQQTWEETFLTNDSTSYRICEWKCILGNNTRLFTNAFAHSNSLSLKDCSGAMQAPF